MRPVFNQCCCCCTLENGGQIIGWIYTVCGLLGAIGCTFLAVVFGMNEEPLLEDAKTALVIVFIILACFSLISSIAGILLIVGVRQRNHRKMILMLVLMVIGIVLPFSNFIFSTETTDIVSVIIGVCIEIYLFLCILSLYNKVRIEGKIKKKEEQRA